jgi:hypothetical protein
LTRREGIAMLEHGALRLACPVYGTIRALDGSIRLSDVAEVIPRAEFRAIDVAGQEVVRDLEDL